MITVVGSLNLDYVTCVERHPRVGETVLGSDLELHPGGKGANQAVAAARAGAQVRMVGCVGRDMAGNLLYGNLEREGVDTSYLQRQDSASGSAFIAVNTQGQNSIVVSPGANAKLRPSDLRVSSFENAKLVLLQLEIPVETTLMAARLARTAGARVVLNLAPAQILSDEQLRDITTLVVNESEAGVLLGRAPQNIKEALLEVQALRELVPEAIITLGAQGAVYANSAGTGHIPSFAVKVVDSTAAGDAFIGALAAALAREMPLEQAVLRGVAAGALACTRVGAQPSLPFESDVDNLLR
ncbi:MAG: ribokinase [Deinococcales bacterium]